MDIGLCCLRIVGGREALVRVASLFFGDIEGAAITVVAGAKRLFAGSAFATTPFLGWGCVSSGGESGDLRFLPMTAAQRM